MASKVALKVEHFMARLKRVMKKSAQRKMTYLSG
jgi:hypothetical protein